MRRVAVALLTLGCSDKTEQPAESVGCPSDLPAEFADTWDCDASQCGTDEQMAYVIGSGSSTQEWVFDAAETWYTFPAGDTACVDTFEMSGAIAPYPPENFSCPQCEEIFEIEWVHTSSTDCDRAWGSLFVDDESVYDGPFPGFLMFDTHSGGERNPADAMDVVAASTSGNHYYAHYDYATGTATPTGDNLSQPPEDYVWAGPGVCVPLGGG